MIAEAPTKEIESIEEFTLFSLDRSQDGLQALVAEAGHCAALLRETATPDGLREISAFMEHLHDLDLFEHNVCSLFGVDRSRTGDSQGTLAEAAATFRAALPSLGDRLAVRDFHNAAGLIVGELCESILRLKDLFPALRMHISREYKLEANHGPGINGGTQ